MYPRGTARALLRTDHLTAPTRAALEARLTPAAAADAVEPRFLDPTSYATLRAACARLVPQSAGGADAAYPVDLAAMIDRRLADGRGDGWRYDRMPPDGDAYRLGLRGIDDGARAMFGAGFVALSAADQDAVLGAVQRGDAPGECWRAVPAALFFEELLAECVQGYYSHPLAQDEIGYAGYADAHGWQAVGLDRLEAREPRPLAREQAAEQHD